ELLLEAQRARLLGRDRPANLAAKLLQAVVVELAELLDRDLGRSDLGDRRAPKTPENVADAPQDENTRDQGENDPHQDAADPVGGSLSQSAKHFGPKSLIVGIRPTHVPVSQGRASY